MSSVNHKARSHSQLGASSSHRWFECQASIPLSVGIESEESEYAKEGTAAHELADKCLTEDKNAFMYLGQQINGFTVTEDMADAVQVYLDTVRKMIKPHSEVLIEERFQLDWIDEELYGTNDCAIINPFLDLTIIDYKHGRGIPVEAVGNEQLLYYALGAARGVDVDTINLVIVQPRCEHRDGPVRTWTITMKELEEFETRLKTKVNFVKEARNAKNDDVYKFAKSGSHCKFCPAAGFCKKLREDAMNTAIAEFDDKGTVVLPDPNTLDIDTLSKVLNGKGLIEDWLKSVEQYALNCAERGTTIPGYKLVQKRANRQWINESDVLSEFEPIFGEAIYTKKIKSPAQLEKLIGSDVEKFTTKPDNGNTLAPLSDKRPAVKPSITEDFTDI